MGGARRAEGSPAEAKRHADAGEDDDEADGASDTAAAARAVTPDDPKLLQPPAGRGLDGSLGDVEGGGGLGDRGVEQVTANKHLRRPGASRLVELGYGRTQGSVWPGLPRLTSRT